MTHITIERAKLDQALEAHQAMREWIDAVPDDTVLPAMPGCDRDWLDTVEAALKQARSAPTVQEPVAWAKQTDKKLRIALNMQEMDGWRPLVFGDTTPPAQPAPVQEPARKEVYGDSDSYGTGGSYAVGGCYGPAAFTDGDHDGY